MRIAMVCPFGVRVKGTVPARVLPAARSLAARGHQVAVLIPPWDSPEDAGREVRAGRLRVRHLPLAGRTPVGWPLLAWRLAREAWESGAEVLHCFKPKGFSGGVHFLTHLRRGGAGLPAVVVDSDDWEGPGGWSDLAGYPLPLRWCFAWQERWGLRHADALTLASRTLVARARAVGAAPERTCYLPNALEEDHPALRAAPWAGGAAGAGRVVLLYSRFWEFAPARVARRLALLRKVVPGLEVWMAGRGHGAHEGRWRAALAAHGLADVTRWLGWVEPERLP
ncbi:MAG: glycosyltransferase, partial [Anaerolineae bacterium]|nr:glycosyltransferase [Anaerolineae bacterium]